MRINRDGFTRLTPSAGYGASFASRGAEVGELLRSVRRGGDDVLRELTARHDGVTLGEDQLQVAPETLEAAVAALEPDVLAGLQTAMRNIRTVVEAQLRDPVTVDLPEGQRVEVLEEPVFRVGVYAPGGRAAYPTSVLMCAVTARAAGVSEIAVCSPPGRPDGELNSVLLAACALCEVDEVYRVGGAQAIAALAYGTESIAAVDVITGPGNYWVTEAKRQVAGHVGIDGLAGPSELIVIAAGEVDAELVALDLLAQAEHGAECLVGLLSPDAELIDAVAAAVERLAPERPSVQDVELQLQRTDLDRALEIVAELAPEHLELVGADAEALADRVRRVGCLFVGRDAATAFGDYVAGSNHVLPTGGAARFQSALSAATFRRRTARVSLPDGAAARLAPAGGALARAEGFPVHAESMERRA